MWITDSVANARSLQVRAVSYLAEINPTESVKYDLPMVQLTIRADWVDVMWGTDLTSTMTDEGQPSTFIAVDHCAAECAASTRSTTARPSARHPRGTPCDALRSPGADPPGCPHLLRRLGRDGLGVDAVSQNRGPLQDSKEICPKCGELAHTLAV
jgi:hypothetical protein